MTPRPVAIITGAGSGIGREIAQLLAAADYRVVLVGRREEALCETASLVHQAHPTSPEPVVLPADLGDANAPAHIVSQAIQLCSRVDALVNNAGIAELVPIVQTDDHLLRRTFAVNTTGPALLIAAVWPAFTAQGSGCVVNISSMATADPFPGFFVYAASKAALESLTRSIVNESGDHAIRAFSVAPGAVETPMLRASFDESQLPPTATLDPRIVAQVAVDCILGRRDADLGKTIYLPNA